MVTSKGLVVLYLFFCKVPQVLLSHHCSARRPGAVQCFGNVWTEPAPVIQMGQNVSINCHSSKEICQNGKLSMRLNDTDVEDRLLSVINKTTVQLNLHDYKEPFSIVLCYIKCSQDRLICGTQFCMGHLPDKPANITCIKPEHSDNMTCSWNPGRETHLSTSYILYLKSLSAAENRTFATDSTSVIIPVNQLQKKQTFSISVCSENYLGMVYSDEVHVDLNNIVTPAVPVIIQNKTVDYPVFKTIIQWKRQTALNETDCEERYKDTISEIWQVREWDANLRDEIYTEYNLDANTKYEFQIRCKQIHPRSVWSRWSETAVYITPDKGPSAVLDVWRNLGPIYPNGSQEITILIKPLSIKESRGRILNYRIFCKNQGEIVDLCKTTEIFCKVLVPPAVTILYVIAHNFKGGSKPANITVKQPHNSHDFPPPTDVKMFPDQERGIFIMWKPPKSLGKTLLWYIVEWISADFNHFHHSFVWKKVPFQNTTTSIAENTRMQNNFTISVFAVYQNGISPACTIQTLMKDFQGTDQESSSAIISGNDDYDTRILLGTGVGVAFLSISVLALIAIESCRKRVHKMFSSVTPKWLSEEYPKMQNSKAIRYLQEKSDPVMHHLTRSFLEYEDVIVTKVEETLVHKQCKTIKKSREAVSEKVTIPEDLLFTSNSDVMERNGYKPQTSNKAQLRTTSSTTYRINVQNMETRSYSSVEPMNHLMKEYVSPTMTTWPVVDTNENNFLFDKISLIFGNSGNGQSRISLTDEEPSTQKANQMKFLLSDEDIQEQTLIPDDLLSCLKTIDEDSIKVMPYFPQSTAKLAYYED